MLQAIISSETIAPPALSEDGLITAIQAVQVGRRSGAPSAMLVTSLHCVRRFALRLRADASSRTRYCADIVTEAQLTMAAGSWFMAPDLSRLVVGDIVRRTMMLLRVDAQVAKSSRPHCLLMGRAMSIAAPNARKPRVGFVQSASLPHDRRSLSGRECIGAPWLAAVDWRCREIAVSLHQTPCRLSRRQGPSATAGDSPYAHCSQCSNASMRMWPISTTTACTL